MSNQVHTIEVKFEEGKAPAYHASMEILGGSIQSVSFVPQLERNNEALELIDELEECISDLDLFRGEREEVDSIIENIKKLL